MKSGIRRGNTNSNMKMCLITPYLKEEAKLPKRQQGAMQEDMQENMLTRWYFSSIKV